MLPATSGKKEKGKWLKQPNKIMNKLFENWRKKLKEDCWDGYERVPGSKEGSPGSCRKKTNEAEEIKEGEICDAGISYVIRTDPGGKDIKRGKDKDGDGKGDLQNWSARAAQIASKYCKDPDYGKGRGKDAKDESLMSEKDGGLGDWEKENWTHSDGSPCGGGKEDGSKSRCKPASKWKTMSKGEKAADNAKKRAGTKAGKQHVPATKKGKVTKGHTKRESIDYSGRGYDEMKLTMEILNEFIEEEIVAQEAKSKAKGKRFAKKVKDPKTGRTRTVNYGQSGKAKDGGDRIRPGTKKADAYCARSAKIKKCKNPPCANDLSRKKWKCRGDKSVAEELAIETTE
jgi:hypothetical protein